MKRKLFLLATFITCAFSAFAENDAIVVKGSDGTTAEFLLSYKPTVIYQADAIIVEAPKDNTVLTFSLEDKITVELCESSSTAVEQETVVIKKPQFSITDTGIAVSGLEPKSEVLVYTIGGMLVSATAADNNGQVQVALTESTVYVVKTSTLTFKIRK